MKEYKKVTKTHETTILYKQVCDFCGKTIVKDGEHVLNDDLHLDEVVISHKPGWRDDFGEWQEIKYSVDMCSECFQGKLRVWIESQGVVIREET